MKIANYINDLLYRYDCVIVPDFGGFVTNTIGAKVNHFTHTFYPPTKQISFNSYLKHNDGLLANYIASSENISFEKATAAIASVVSDWKKELETTTVLIEKVGNISLNKEQKIIFTPNASVNYLTESFGLAPTSSAAVKREFKHVEPTVIPIQKEENKKIPAFIKYAATAAILLTLGYGIYNKQQSKQQKEVFANQQKELENKIQSATFVISNPLPTINLNVAKEVIVAKPFHIIAGAFQIEENAAKKVEQLQQKGFDAKIIGVNKWGLTQVTFDSYETREEAVENLEVIRKSEAKGAWLLVKNLK